METRGKRKFQTEFGARDYYKYYRKKSKFPKHLHVDKLLGSSLFRQILSEYFKLISEELFKNNSFMLPCGFGWLSIIKLKPKIIGRRGQVLLSIDWKESKKLKKKVYHLNEHREGYVYKFHWKKPRHHKGISWYKFKPSRFNNRHLAKLLKEDKSIDFFDKTFIRHDFTQTNI
jgi:hypothetical protein